MEIANHECYVSLEVAQLLKETGFDWSCNHAICCNSTSYPNLKEGDVLEYNYLECSELMKGKKPHMLLCPTLEVAQRWLREVKGILLYMTPKRVNMEWKWGFWYIDLRDKTNIEQRYSTKNFNTYEKAQETGIKKALELL